MPSVSGWALRPPSTPTHICSWHCFYALGFGLGFATDSGSGSASPATGRFYALGFGLGFATAAITILPHLLNRRFLCPRFQAGLCDAGFKGIPDPVRVGDHVSMPSVSGWALRQHTTYHAYPWSLFLYPRFRAGLCDSTSSPLSTLACGFYALGIGLGFAT